MRPEWINESNVPFDVMWPDDKLWLPRVLSDEVGLHYRFWHSFNTSQIVRFEKLA
jgi:hypothetical protein